MATEQGTREEELVQDVLRCFDKKERARGIWNGHWEEVAQKVLPHFSTSFYSQQNMVPGVKRTQNQYDVTAMLALNKFAAAMESMLTPANSRWHGIRPVDPVLKRNREARDWFDTITERLFHYRYSPHSGFQGQMHEGYIGIGAFGTACLFTDEFKDPTLPSMRGLRYRQVPLGECYFDTNFQGQVDTVYRKFKMTYRQLMQRQKTDGWSIPEVVMEKVKTEPETEVFVIHCVRPNAEYEPGRFDAKGKRFASIYALQTPKHLLHEGGYRTMPYSVPRYLTAPGEAYGRGPAMLVLPSIKTLDEEKKITLKQGHRVVDPVLLVHDEGVLEGFSLKPGALNPGGVSAEGRPLVHPLPTGNIAVSKEMMDDERFAINDAFLVTLFQILVETPQMTATEVLERAREKGALLSPTMGRFQSEGLGPMIEREVDLLVWQGLVPPPPPIVVEAGAEYRVEYDAPLNRAMRAEEAAGGMRTFQFATEMAAQMQDPSILDPFDTDVMIPELAEINAMPLRWLRTPEAVEARRQARQQDQVAAQMTQALPGMAAMMKATSPEGTSPTGGQPA